MTEPDPTTPADPTPAPAPAPDPAPTPAPADPTPPAAPPIGPDGKLAKEWYLTLGDEFAPYAKDLEKFQDIRHLVQQYKHFQKNGVEYPAGPDADPKTVERFRSIAGVPDSPDGYGLTAETMKLPAGMEFDGELAAAVTAAAHATHTPPAAVQAIASAFNDILAKRATDAAAAAQAQAKEAQDQLVKEWRGDFDRNASTVRHLTARLAESAGITPEDPSIQQLANNPAFARMIHQVSNLIGEDRVRTPSQFGDLRSPTQKIQDIQSGNDPVWSPKYFKGTDKEKQEAFEYVSRLREQAAQ
jgi:hypothetical protein